MNPHCEHCKEELEDSHICQTCEILKSELSHSRQENRLLIEKITRTETDNPPVTIPHEPAVPVRQNVPWHVRRQMLEASDREKAKAMREAAKPVSDSNESLEKELGVQSNA